MPKSIVELIGPIDPVPAADPEWSMYIYSWPSIYFWDHFIQELQARGWNRSQIKEYLQSTRNRHEFEYIEPDLTELARRYANIVTAPS